MLYLWVLGDKNVLWFSGVASLGDYPFLIREYHLFLPSSIFMSIFSAGVLFSSPMCGLRKL